MSRFSKAVKKVSSNPIAQAVNPITAFSALAASDPKNIKKNIFGSKSSPAAPGALTDEQIAAIVGDPSIDVNKIQENARKNYALRQQQLNDLAGVLASNRQKNMDFAIPQIAENANVAGIYRSTGFGNALAQKNAELMAADQNTIARAGIDNTDILTGGNDAALGRNLSLADFGRDLKASSTLGAQFAPKVQQPGKVGTTMSGAVGGGAAGAPFGPWGAAIGAGAGAVAGNATAKGK